MAANQWVDGAYYVGADGVMLVSTTTPDGKKVGADGKKVDERWKDVMIASLSGYVFAGEGSFGEYVKQYKGLGDINGDGIPEIFYGGGIDAPGGIYYFDGTQMVDPLEEINAYLIFYAKGYRIHNGMHVNVIDEVVRYKGSKFEPVAYGMWDMSERTGEIETENKTFTFTDVDAYASKLVELVGGGEPIEPKVMYPNASRSELIQIIRNW